MLMLVVAVLLLLLAAPAHGILLLALVDWRVVVATIMVLCITLL
jgi:hypothetical protein